MNEEKYRKDIETLKKLGYVEQYKNSNLWEEKNSKYGLYISPLLEYNFERDSWSIRRSNGFAYAEALSPIEAIISTYDKSIAEFEYKIKCLKNDKERFLESLKELEPPHKEEVNE